MFFFSTCTLTHIAPSFLFFKTFCIHKYDTSSQYFIRISASQRLHLMLLFFLFRLLFLGFYSSIFTIFIWYCVCPKYFINVLNTWTACLLNEHKMKTTEKKKKTKRKKVFLLMVSHNASHSLCLSCCVFICVLSCYAGIHLNWIEEKVRCCCETDHNMKCSTDWGEYTF